ncbi:MAG TPA: MFS transporter [Actinomycetota bacterium]|nr:MFS transporter [Actinomycetota bacterium]
MGSRASNQAAAAATTAARGVLLTLAAGQFLMTLDSSVMNVSIATVADDLGTTVTGIQTAITLYTLVMASLMITGGKIGTIIGRRKAFAIGCVIYACGSFTTSIAPNLGVLLFGWSLLEGIGAALIMPAIVGLVAANFPKGDRPRAYGLIAAAGAMAVAAGPLIGGLVTTCCSWRWVFAGEVLVVAVILIMVRRIADEPTGAHPKLDLVGSALSVVGLSMAVFGVLRSGTWGWVQPKEGAPSWFGLSPTTWLIVGGAVVLWLLLEWEKHLKAAGREPLVDPSMLENKLLRGGLTMFFFQFFVQAGLFFIVPLFLSVVLGLSALSTGLRLLPLSIMLLVAAVGVPRFFPQASPRRVVRIGVFLLIAGVVSLIGGLELGAGADITTVPMILVGLGVGALASQLGAVTVSAVPDEQSGEVGGLQNTLTNLGASLGTALAGSVLIASLTATLLAGLSENPEVSQQVSSQATTQLAAGVPFVSDAQLETALAEAGVPAEETDAIVDENATARIQGLRAALFVIALMSVLALFFTGRIPDRPASGEPTPA